MRGPLWQTHCWCWRERAVNPRLIDPPVIARRRGSWCKEKETASPAQGAAHCFPARLRAARCNLRAGQRWAVPCCCPTPVSRLAALSSARVTDAAARAGGAAAPPEPPLLTVGCAITAKKAASFLKPGLVEAAAVRGVRLLAIDLARPLQEQGPFDVILHKARGTAGRRAGFAGRKRARSGAARSNPLAAPPHPSEESSEQSSGGAAGRGAPPRRPVGWWGPRPASYEPARGPGLILL